MNRGSTTEDRLQEYRGRIDYKSRTKDRLQESKSSTEAEGYKNTTRRLLIQSIGESPLFDYWIEEYQTPLRGVFPEPQQEDQLHEPVAKNKGHVNITGRGVEEEPLQSRSNEQGLKECR